MRQAPNGLCCPPQQAWVPAMNGCMPVANACPPGQHDSAGRCCGQGEEFVPAQNACVCVQPGGCFAAAPPGYPQPQQPAYPPQQPMYPQQQPMYPQQPPAPQGGLVQTQVSACYAGDTDACVDAAVALRDGTQGVRDDTQSVVLLRRACGQNYARACSVLGYAFEAGRGVRVDVNQSRALYERACNGGYPTGCHNFATVYYDGRGVPRDRARAAQLYERACQMGAAESCPMVERARQESQADQQVQRAQTSDACNTLRIMHHMADLVGDRAAAAPVAQREQVACSMGGAVGDERWPNGLMMHSSASNDWTYANGLVARYGASGNWMYPNGLTMLFGASNNWMYPNGLTMLFGASGTYAQPDGINTSEQGLVTWACARIDANRCARLTRELNANQGFWRNMYLLELVWAAQRR